MTRRLAFSATLLALLLSSGCGGKDGPTDPGSNGELLTLPATVTGLAGARESLKLYRVTVPPDAYQFRITTTGGGGDVDIFVRFDDEPTLSDFDCEAVTYGNDDTCIIGPAEEGTWYILLYAADPYTDVTLRVTVSVEF
jgi:hypothetical protein